jgi:lysozyme family protein
MHSTDDPAFDKQIELTISFEGSGLNDSRATTGELSRYGISLKSFPELGEQGIINLTEYQAIELYKREIWDHYGFGVWPVALSGKCFDMVVNPGAGNGLKVLKAALISIGSPEDQVNAVKGWRDPDLLALVKSANSEKLHNAIRHELTTYYTDAALSGRFDPKFLRGLLKRAIS